MPKVLEVTSYELRVPEKLFRFQGFEGKRFIKQTGFKGSREKRISNIEQGIKNIEG